MTMQNYAYYNRLFKPLDLPLAYCDMDMLQQNINDIADRCSGTDKKIRIASKSLRCRYIIQHILESHPIYKGIMSFCGAEANFLLENDFDDILIGYPIVNESEIREICAWTKKGKKVYLMTDDKVHLEIINRIAAEENIFQPVCIDIDMSTDFPGIHFGVLRSPLNSISKAKKFIDQFENYPHIVLKGVMGYEAQIAGLGDKNPANGMKNILIPTLKKKSIADFTKRREEIVHYIKSKKIELDFVNAGGTGSIESSKTEDWVTEITVGSGFYSPALFDYYSNFKHQPAVGFALPIVRSPKNGYFTCLGGGYIASGTTGQDKQPLPYLPKGVDLTENEGCGEVQTPFAYKGKETIEIGDIILFRHAKAGEICERFNELQLVSNGEIIKKVPTYRGEGKSFL